MTKEEFKKRWDSDDDGGGITYDDLADCAIKWGLFSRPKTMDMELVKKVVLRHSGCAQPQSNKAVEE